MPPQATRSLPTCTRPTPQVPRQTPMSKIMYWATCMRLMSVLLSLLFIPMVAVPIGMTDLVIAMLAGVSISIMWDVFAVLHRFITKRCAPWPLLITFDLIIIPTMLLVFGASAYLDGIAPKAPDSYERTIMALVLFVLISTLHLISVILDLKKLLTPKRKPNFTTPPRCRSSTPVPMRSVPQRTANNSSDALFATDDMDDIFLARPEEALFKQRADGEPFGRLTGMTRSNSLPMYSMTDPTGAVPSYDFGIPK